VVVDCHHDIRFGYIGESKCANGSTNIDCNYWILEFPGAKSRDHATVYLANACHQLTAWENTITGSVSRSQHLRC